MSAEASVVVVVRGSNEIGIDSINERHLSGREPAPVDGEGIHSDIPQSDGVEGSLAQHHDRSMHGRVVEQKPTHVHSVGVLVLRTLLPVKLASDDAKYLASHSAQRVSDRIISWVISQSKVDSSVIANAISPIGVGSSGVPPVEPGFGKDTLRLQLLVVPVTKLLVVGLHAGCLPGQSSPSPAGVAEPGLLEHVHAGAGMGVSMHGTQEGTFSAVTVGQGLREGVGPHETSQESALTIQCSLGRSG